MTRRTRRLAHASCGAALALSLLACLLPVRPRPAAALTAATPLPHNVALTFDDGPNPDATPKVLDILDREHVKATFFLIGEMAKAYPGLVKEILARGHSIGNHSWSHPALTMLTDDNLTREIEDTSDILRGLTGHAPSCMRPPYGNHDARVDAAITSRGMLVVMWDVDPVDWRKPGTDVIERRVLNQAHPGSIVLMHDGGGDRSQTVAALPTIINGLRARGLGFDQLCQPRPHKVLPMAF